MIRQGQILYLFASLFLMIGMTPAKVVSQNLVPNWDFETYISCPGGLNDLTCTGWFSPNHSTPDYHNVCGSLDGHSVPSGDTYTEWPVSGDGYVGMLCYGNTSATGLWYEYVSVRLNSPLQKDSVYHLEFSASLTDYSKWCMKELGMVFSADSIGSKDSTLYDSIPALQGSDFIELSNGWTKISGDYIANGTELFLTLGKFLPNSLLTVKRVYPFPNPDAGDNGAHYLIDDVIVELKSSFNPNTVPEVLSLLPFPNPFSDILYLRNTDSYIHHINVFNSIGELVYTKTNPPLTMQLESRSLSLGMYTIVIIDHAGTSSHYKVVKQ
ncbi:MAG: OOP family OmpA-OmpF porin [Parvicellaceae bacterium]|jgi:OOP family OmpA-OmpF porin